MSDSIWKHAILDGDLNDLDTEDLEVPELSLEHVHVVLSLQVAGVLVGLALIGLTATISKVTRLIRR